MVDIPHPGSGIFANWHASPLGPRSLNPDGPLDVMGISKAIAKATHQPDPRGPLGLSIFMMPPAGALIPT